MLPIPSLLFIYLNIYIYNSYINVQKFGSNRETKLIVKKKGSKVTNLMFIIYLSKYLQIVIFNLV